MFNFRISVFQNCSFLLLPTYCPINSWVPSSDLFTIIRTASMQMSMILAWFHRTTNLLRLKMFTFHSSESAKLYCDVKQNS